MPSTSTPVHKKGLKNHFVLRFKIDDFESLPVNPLDAFIIPEILTDDEVRNEWRLELETSPRVQDAEKNFSVALFSVKGYGEMGDADIKIAFIVRDKFGGVYRYRPLDGQHTILEDEYDEGFGTDLIKRSEILDKTNNLLVDETTLVIDVEVQVVDLDPPPADYGINKFKHENPHLKNMMKLLKNGDDSDISFKVGDVAIPAHKLILKSNAPILHSFCTEIEGGPSLVDINDTTPEIFRILLHYVYGGDDAKALYMWHEISADEEKAAQQDENKPNSLERINKLGMDIIEAANRYGVVGLKLAVEADLVEQYVVNMNNAVEWILFADAMTCPLLQEYATSYFSDMIKDILSSESAEKLKTSPRLMSELMIAISNNPNDHFDPMDSMTVSELRTELRRKSLDVDGSKEALISRLKVSNKRQRTE